MIVSAMRSSSMRTGKKPRPTNLMWVTKLHTPLLSQAAADPGRRQIDLRSAPHNEGDRHFVVTELREAESSLERLAVAHFAEGAISAGGYRVARAALVDRVATLTGRLAASER